MKGIILTIDIFFVWQCSFVSAVHKPRAIFYNVDEPSLATTRILAEKADGICHNLAVDYKTDGVEFIHCSYDICLNLYNEQNCPTGSFFDTVNSNKGEVSLGYSVISYKQVPC